MPAASPDSAPAMVVGHLEKWQPGCFNEHVHHKHQLMFATEGVLHVTSGTREWVLPPSRAIWISGGIRHSVSLKKPAMANVLYIQPTLVPRMSQGDCFVLDVPPLIKHLIIACTDFVWDYPVESPQARLAQVLLDQLSVVDQSPMLLPLPADRRALAVAEALRETPGTRESLAVLARLHGTSARTVERLFARETGMSFGQWRQRLRMIGAVELLAYGGSVANVAAEIGYGAPSAFIAAFRDTFGVTPSHYFLKAKRAITPFASSG